MYPSQNRLLPLREIYLHSVPPTVDPVLLRDHVPFLYVTRRRRERFLSPSDWTEKGGVDERSFGLRSRLRGLWGPCPTTPRVESRNESPTPETVG